MKERLMNDLKEAMKSTDENKAVKLNAIKAVRQAVTEWEKDPKNSGKEISEEQFVTIVDKLVKDRNKSITEYTKAGREDLCVNERIEIETISVYLPERVSEDEIRSAALSLKEELGVTDMKGMGQMMGKMKAQFGTSATPADISRIVKEILS
jgi:uncharacterized protein YqeY